MAARDGGERERAEMVDTFLPRIAAIARDYRRVPSVNREELMQAGVLGLLRAFERYDPTRANQFWSYAQWWVRESMQELVSSVSGVVVFSDRALRQLARVNVARHRHHQVRGHEPSIDDLVAMTGLAPAQITRLEAAAQWPHTLDAQVHTSGPWARPLAESLRDPASEDGFEHAALRAAAGALAEVLETLTPRELVIIRGRYGIGREERSVRELAGEQGLTIERVRQIERGAMAKLRNSCDAAVAA
ncbi:MAG: polymerase primary sigma factor [Solirubrobacteraceae bacterium]|nr:polymerase primary sigma factor [Solirubrobacteraceae bacterium]